MTSVDSYIEKHNAEVVQILTCLRDIIFSCSIKIQESIKHRIPFYSIYGNICYVNVRKNNVVDLGFINGSSLANQQGLLESKERVSVRSISFSKALDINKNTVRELISEAIIIDELNKRS